MEITLKSFNIHCGGVKYDWSGVYDLEGFLTPFEDDVVVLQEALSVDNVRFPLPPEYSIESLLLFPEMRSLNSEGDIVSYEGYTHILSKLPIVDRRVLSLKKYGQDTRDKVLAVTVVKNDIKINIIGVHLTTAMLPFGSFLQSLELSKNLPSGPVVVLGDHNLWGPLLSMAYRGKLLHAGTGPTWPSKRPYHQIDHIWFSGFKTTEYHVLDSGGSDHLAIRARLKYLS